MGKNPGINVYEASWEKLTRDKAFEGYMPEEVCISLLQNENSICRPMVLPGEYVSRGQVIGEPVCETDACVHSSIAGYVKEIYHYQRAPGVLEPYVKISKVAESCPQWHHFALNLNRDAVLQAIRQIGISPGRLSKVRILVVNGFANEPYITSGYRLIMESPGKIVIGAILGAMAAEAETIYICINEDAFDAVARIKRAVQKYAKNEGNRCPICVLPMKRHYPKGNDQMILREIPEKAKDSAAVVTIAEMAALYDGIYDGEPWTKVGITVSGEIPHPKNLWVPVGTNVEDIINYCGGKPKGTVLIHGGPLGGQAVNGKNTWITRQTTGILVLRLPNIPMTACVHCGMCRDVCPQGLRPDQIERKYLAGGDISDSDKVPACIHCGLCSYVCPAGRRLTEYIGQVKKGRMRKKDMEFGKKKKGDYIELSREQIKMKKMKTLEQKSQSAPHIHRRGTIYDVMRHSIFSLLPLIGAAFYMNPGNRIYLAAMLMVGVLSGWLSEYFWQSIFRKGFSACDGSAVFTGLLLTLLFSIDTPLWKISLAAVTAIILGKQIFGGIGYSPIHPVIVGKIVFGLSSVPLIEPLWPFALFALLWMILTKMVPVVYPAIFLGIVSLVMPEWLMSGCFYLGGAFFVWSYETMSPFRLGKWLMPVGMALFTLLFQKMGAGINSIFFSVACMNLCISDVKRI